MFLNKFIKKYQNYRKWKKHFIDVSSSNFDEIKSLTKINDFNYFAKNINCTLKTFCYLAYYNVIYLLVIFCTLCHFQNIYTNCKLYLFHELVHAIIRYFGID